MLQAMEKIKQCFGLTSPDSRSLFTSDDRDATSERSEQYDFDENKERGNWAGRPDFVLSLLG